MAKYAFLSDEWFAVVDQLATEHGGAEAPTGTEVMMNVTVTDTPFGAERQLHMGARQGQAIWGLGHLDDADVQLTTDYATARDVFVAGDPTAGMQAFMAGKVKVQGDMAKLLAAQAASAQPGAAAALQAAIEGITE